MASSQEAHASERIAIEEAFVYGAHQECSYSKATHGNINVMTNFETKFASHVA